MCAFVRRSLSIMQGTAPMRARLSALHRRVGAVRGTGHVGFRRVGPLAPVRCPVASVASVAEPITFVGSPFAYVGGSVALNSFVVAIVSNFVPLVAEPVTPVGGKVSQVGGKVSQVRVLITRGRSIVAECIVLISLAHHEMSDILSFVFVSLVFVDRLPISTVGQAELFGVRGSDARDATTVAQRHAAPESPLMIARAGDDWAEQFGIESPTRSHGMNNTTGGAFARGGTGDTHTHAIYRWRSSQRRSSSVDSSGSNSARK